MNKYVNLTGKDGSSTLGIRAHKWPLAGVSPVFMKQFLGPNSKKDVRELIDVEKTTAEAFQTMIDYIYIQTSSRAGQEAFTLNSINCPQKLHDTAVTRMNEYFADAMKVQF